MSKLYDNSFFKNLEDFDIVCLLETFINTDVLPDDFLPSFIRYFSPALKLSAHGRCSGGAVFVKKSLKDFCEIIKHDFCNITALKLRNTCVEGMGILFLSLLIFLLIHPHTIIPCNMIIVFTCSNNVLLNYRQNIRNVALYYVATLTLELRVQPLKECVTAYKYVENLNSSSFFHEMQGLYSSRSEDSIVNGYGRSLLEMCAGFEFMILNGMCSSNPKGSFTFLSSHGNSIIF